MGGENWRNYKYGCTTVLGPWEKGKGGKGESRPAKSKLKYHREFPKILNYRGVFC